MGQQTMGLLERMHAAERRDLDAWAQSVREAIEKKRRASEPR